MLNFQKDDRDLAMVDRIQNDIILAGMDASNVRISCELPRPGMPGVLGQKPDLPPDAFLDVRGKFAHIAIGGIGKDHMKGHSQPQLAFDLFPRNTFAAALLEGPQFSVGDLAERSILLDQLTELRTLLLQAVKIPAGDNHKFLAADVQICDCHILTFPRCGVRTILRI